MRHPRHECILTVGVWILLICGLLFHPTNGQNPSVASLMFTTTVMSVDATSQVVPSLTSVMTNSSVTPLSSMPQTMSIASSSVISITTTALGPPVTTDVMVTSMLMTTMTMTSAMSVTPSPTPSQVITSTVIDVVPSSSSVLFSGTTSLPGPSTTPVTDPPITTTRSTSPPTMEGLPIGAIIGIAVGAGLGAVVIILLLLFCCCCCLCGCCGVGSKEEYVVRPYGNVVVRTWDPRTQHGHTDSITGGSFRSNGRNSLARSSISSVGSFLRASIRRLSGKRRSGKKNSSMVPEDEVAMKVTPL